MGCGPSLPMVCGPSLSVLESPVYAHIVRTFDAQIRALRVSKDEVDALYLAWVRGDANADAFLSKAEFHAMLGMRESKLTLRIYGIMDRKRTGEVDFGEWFCSCWLYLSFSRMSLIALAFQLIDADNNGTIDDEEMAAFVHDLSASQLGRDRNVNWHQLTFDIQAAHNASNSALTSEQRAAKRRAREVTEPIFARYALKNPSVLYPALHVQEVLREIICGKAFWLGATERRAGRPEVSLVVDFYEQIKLDVRQHNLLQSIVGLMDGRVVAADLAPSGDVERIRDVWSRTFGVGKRELMLNRGDSLKQLNDARGGRPRRSFAAVVRGMSSKLLAVKGFQAPSARKGAAKAKGRVGDEPSKGAAGRSTTV